jgi:hypothetical protein
VSKSDLTFVLFIVYDYSYSPRDDYDLSIDRQTEGKEINKRTIGIRKSVRCLFYSLINIDAIKNISDF